MEKNDLFTNFLVISKYFFRDIESIFILSFLNVGLITYRKSAYHHKILQVLAECIFVLSTSVNLLMLTPNTVKLSAELLNARKLQKTVINYCSQLQKQEDINFYENVKV